MAARMTTAATPRNVFSRFCIALLLRCPLRLRPVSRVGARCNAVVTGRILMCKTSGERVACGGDRGDFGPHHRVFPLRRGGCDRPVARSARPRRRRRGTPGAEADDAALRAVPPAAHHLRRLRRGDARHRRVHGPVQGVRLRRHVEGSWTDWLTFGLGCLENAALPRNAERLARALVDRARSAITRLRTEFLAEDYFVFTMTGIEGSPPADAMVASHGGAIAQLLRGERSPLSGEERDEVLRHRISYF